jgi:hypothetical protein
LGTGLPWAVFVLSLHVAASMAAPIALVESCARGRSRSPWLHRRGLAVTAAVYLLGCAITVALNRAMRGDHPFSAPWPRLLCVAGLAALLVAAVVLAPRRRDAGGTGRGRGAGVAPAPAVVAVAVGVAATLVVWPGAALTAVGPWWTPAIGVAAWLVVALLLARWSRGVGWGQRHVAAAATGIVAAFAASLLQKGAVTSQWPLAIATDLILLAGLAWVVRTAWRRAGSATAPAPLLQAGRAQSRDIRSDGRSEPSPPFS